MFGGKVTVKIRFVFFSFFFSIQGRPPKQKPYNGTDMLTSLKQRRPHSSNTISFLLASLHTISFNNGRKERHNLRLLGARTANSAPVSFEKVSLGFYLG